MPQISRTARLAVYSRLSDVGIGYNANLLAAAPGYFPASIDTSLLLIPSWIAGAPNFLFGRVNPDAIEASDIIEYPLCSIDTANTADTGYTVSAIFSGTVSVLVDLHISWRNEGVIPDFASFADLAEDALFATLNTPASPIRGNGFTSYGRMMLTRGGIQMGKGQNWRQTLTVTLPIRIVTP